MDIVHPSLLFRIAKRYQTDMTSSELYEATRGVWKLGERRESAQYAMAVAYGRVREVYRIDAWHPAGSTLYQTRTVGDEVDLQGRWEFDGEIAESEVRDRYLGTDVSHLFRQGNSNPVTYAGP